MAMWRLIVRISFFHNHHSRRIARSVAREGQAGEPVSIEHRGKFVRQLVLMPDGKVEEEVIV
jgi:hypothetical protein